MAFYFLDDPILHSLGFVIRGMHVALSYAVITEVVSYVFP